MQEPFKPTDKHRSQVCEMASGGTRQDDICQALGISKPTLRKYFREELDTAATIANAKVAATLFEMATSGTCIAATIFWLKTRAGWRELPPADTPVTTIIMSPMDAAL